MLAKVLLGRDRSPRIVGQQRLHPIAAFVARRVSAGLILLIIISILIFVATNVLPGDVASAVLSRQATQEALEALRAELGLHRPLHEQYFSWIIAFLRGDLGVSLAARRPVAELIGARVGNTLQLASLVIAVLVPLSVLVGVISGIRARGVLDQSISSLTLWIIAIPEFVIGAVLVLVFAVSFAVAPSVSLIPPGEGVFSNLRAVILPAATLIIAGTAYMARIIRAGVADVMSSGYVEMARLNGVRERRIVVRFVLRNSIAPSVQAFAWILQWLIGGVLIVETLFAFPGIGQTLVNAVQTRDLVLVQGIGMIVAATYISINIAADLAVALLVPKLRTSL